MNSNERETEIEEMHMYKYENCRNVSAHPKIERIIEKILFKHFSSNAFSETKQNA